jgi:hypothetical protein
MARDGSVVSKLVEYAQERQTLAGSVRERLRPTDIPKDLTIAQADAHPLMDENELRAQGKAALTKRFLEKKGVKDGPSVYPDGPTMQSQQRMILDKAGVTKEQLKRHERSMEAELERDGPSEENYPGLYGRFPPRAENYRT